MRKTQVALAALALMASTAALAEVKISGVMDVGIGRTSGNGGVGGVYVTNGAFVDHSAIELDASEDMGGGLKAFVSLGAGFNSNGQSDNPGVGLSSTNLYANNNLFNRQAFAGVSGEFGTIKVGRQLSPFVLSNVFMMNYNGMFGVSRMVLAGNGGSAAADTFFKNNAVSYTLPTIMGFTVNAFYTTPNGTRNNNFIDGADAGSATTGRYTAYHVHGPIGPMNLTAAYHKSNGAYTGYNVGGTMALIEGLTASAGYVNTKNSVSGLKIGSWNLGAAYALTGSTTLTVQHAQNDNNGGNQNLSNIMISNALSKRTTVYGGYGWGKNGIGATVDTFGGAVDSTGATSAVSPINNGTTGTNNSAIVVGVAHSF